MTLGEVETLGGMRVTSHEVERQGGVRVTLHEVERQGEVRVTSREVEELGEVRVTSLEVVVPRGYTGWRLNQSPSEFAGGPNLCLGRARAHVHGGQAHSLGEGHLMGNYWTVPRT